MKSNNHDAPRVARRVGFVNYTGRRGPLVLALRNLPPVASNPHPSTIATEPVALDVNRGGPRPGDPAARNPNVVSAAPAPVAARPDVVRTGRNGLRFHPRFRRFLRDVNFGGGRRPGGGCGSSNLASHGGRGRRRHFFVMGTAGQSQQR